MKLLFLLDEVYSPGGPTVRFGRSLAARLAAGGHQVALLENMPETKAPYTDEDGVRHHPFHDEGERRFYDAVAGWRAAGLGPAAMALRLLGRPGLALCAVRLFLLKRSPMEAGFKKRLEALCREESFDAVIAVSAPHYTAFAAARANTGAVKAAYMVDPYTAAATMRHISSRRRERALYRQLDVAFITDVMAERDLYPTRYTDKAFALHFPGIRRPRLAPAADDVRLPGGGVNCLFVGNLYLDIRDPAFAMELFSRLPARYRLVLVGAGYTQFPPALRHRWEQQLGSRLVVHPPVSQAAAFNAMQRADVLVSIGNSDASQLPSKVFDYLSCGHPILNLCKLENCPTLPFLRDYPLAITLREYRRDGAPPVPTAEQVERTTAFLEEKLGQRIPYEELEPLYRDYTPGAVAERMLKILCKR